jgi:hypothetical protein
MGTRSGGKQECMILSSFFPRRNPTPFVDGEIITKKWKPFTAAGEEYFDINDELTNENHLERVGEMSKLIRKYTGHF